MKGNQPNHQVTGQKQQVTGQCQRILYGKKKHHHRQQKQQVTSHYQSCRSQHRVAGGQTRSQSITVGPHIPLLPYGMKRNLGTKHIIEWTWFQFVSATYNNVGSYEFVTHSSCSLQCSAIQQLITYRNGSTLLKIILAKSNRAYLKALCIMDAVVLLVKQYPRYQ